MVRSLEFRVWGLGFGVQGLGFEISGLGFGFRVEDSSLKIQGLEFRV